MEVVLVDIAANGHVWIQTESKAIAKKIGRLLMFRYWFFRWGLFVPPITDEAIFPDYRRGKLRIHAGWDNWVGYDFVSANDATDKFLRRFVDKHLPGATYAEGAA